MPGSRLHEAYFYASDEILVQRLTRVIREALLEDRFAMIFLTREHKDMLQAALLKDGIDLDIAHREARIRLLDARALKETLFDGRRIHQERFNQAFENLLAQGVRSGREMTVCGEIVDLLWQEGQHDAAVQLEQLWDDVLRKHNLHIYCTYASPVGDAQRAALAASVDGFHPNSQA